MKSAQLLRSCVATELGHVLVTPLDLTLLTHKTRPVNTYRFCVVTQLGHVLITSLDLTLLTHKKRLVNTYGFCVVRQLGHVLVTPLDLTLLTHKTCQHLYVLCSHTAGSCACYTTGSHLDDT